MNIILKAMRHEYSGAQIIAISSLFIVFVFNYCFLNGVFEAIEPNNLSQWSFYASVILLLFCLTIIITSILGGIIFPRTILAVTVIVSCLLFYATFQYGVIFDKSMIQNIAETNSGEASSYLNISFLIYFILLGLVPSAMIFKIKIKGDLKSRIKSVLALNLLALIVTASIFTSLYKDYAAVGRNNHNLFKYIVPFAFYDSGFRYLRDNYFYPPLPFKVLDRSPTINPSNQGQQNLTIVVVGETARAQNFSLNGYTRDTNPFLRQIPILSFKQVSSCGTATAVSVPCMFSRLQRSNYESRVASSQDNALDIIQRAGVDVTWVDNNSTCKGVCERVSEIGFDPTQNSPLCNGDACFDEILIEELHQQISQQKSADQLFVLHMIGSHGPTYFQRYPDTFKRFMPDCPQSDIQNCSAEQLKNTYDNTIAYTDFVLSKVIGVLQQSNATNKSLLYISDHGESLGENGLYLHGFPYSIAPEEQTHVPMLYWSTDLANANFKDCMSRKLNSDFSQDNIFDTLLGLANVKSSIYQPEMDIFQQCRTTAIEAKNN
ncbi:MAG: phosphoethanolamine--lipid A transferase [Aliiglaciecola sp.]|uniref:phosphoethanolamine transferase n=1 Tax=Aliiglaciecola sp. TaxID=1872441 RepID=UPI0032971306